MRRPPAQMPRCVRWPRRSAPRVVAESWGCYNAARQGMMRIRLRAKLVVLLLVVAILPLIVATATVVLRMREMRVQSFEQRLAAAAAAEARIMEVSLAKDVARLALVMRRPSVIDAVRQAPPPLSPDERQALDAAWPTLPADDPRVLAVLDNPTSELLRHIQQDDPRMVELLVTDRHGQLVAASGRTSDFYQADELWWREAWHEGAGRIFIPPVSLDRSTGVWSVDLCFPIKSNDEVLGVAKAVLDLSLWVGGPQRDVGEFEAWVALLSSDGAVLYTSPGTREAFGNLETLRTEAWAMRPGRGAVYRHREILAVGRIHIPEQIGLSEVASPTWLLVLHMPQSVPLREVNRLSVVTAALAGGVIAVLFLGGWFLVNRSVVRRVRRLAQATQEVSGGDLTRRVPLEWDGRRLLGRDEIDDLARDFNRMVERVQRSHEMLQAANDLKSRFIKIASHELRTPVTYILGITSMLQRSEDPQRLHQAILAIGDRARRLNEIIQAMFKLLPEQAYGEELHYATVELPALLQQVHESVRPFAEQRNQRIALEFPEGLTPLHADAAKLRDVFENLVMNAVKFTPDGGAIALRVHRQLGGYVSVSVADEGPGIPTEDLPHIFEPFFSGGELYQHSTGQAGYGKRGMGLGLAVVRHFVQLHGGSVRVSTSEAGSTFTVTLPVEPPAREERPEAPEPPPQSPAHPERPEAPPPRFDGTVRYPGGGGEE